MSVFVMSTRIYRNEHRTVSAKQLESSCSSLLVLVQWSLAASTERFNSKLAPDELSSCLYNMTATNPVLSRSNFFANQGGM